MSAIRWILSRQGLTIAGAVFSVIMIADEKKGRMEETYVTGKSRGRHMTDGNMGGTAVYIVPYT